MPQTARRPLRTRRRPLVRVAAAWLGAHGIGPNTVSLLSIVFAGTTAAALVALPHVGTAAQVFLLVAATLGIQLRLLANLLDGLLAVEGGLRSAVGDLFNEVPDRVADLLILVSAGYATTWTGWGGEVGWAAGGDWQAPASSASAPSRPTRRWAEAWNGNTDTPILVPQVVSA
jgi:hypothetical protein